MKRIQIAIKEDKYNKAKRILLENNLTWQKWGESQIDLLYSEKLNDFGIPLMEMAVDREQFKTKIQEKFTGALREHAFVLMAEKNEEEEWVNHKKREVERLILELLDLFDLETKGKWNKKKAAIEAIEFYKKRLKNLAVRSINKFKRYYKIEPHKIISDEDILPFFEKVIKDIEETN